MTKEEILNEKIQANKCHSLDPFNVFEGTKKAALEAMQDFATQAVNDYKNKLIMKFADDVAKEGLSKKPNIHIVKTYKKVINDATTILNQPK